VADVLLTHSYHLPYDRKQVRKMQPYPPLGTLYAAALLRSKGISVAVFDTMLNDPDAGFKEALRTHQPKIVAVYEDDFNFLTKMCLTRMREVAWQMLAEAKKSGCRVVAHGSDATDHVQDYLSGGFDFVLVGEAEQTLLDLVRAIDRGIDTSRIPGVVALDSPLISRDALKRVSSRNLPSDHLPFPARDLIDLEPYRQAWLSSHDSFSLNLIAGRGCPFRCNWCAKPIFGDSFYSQPAEIVAQEMQILKERYRAQHLWFADDIFALNRRWIQQLAAEVEKRNCALPFKIQARADLMSPETVAALKRAGCAEIWMGVESGSQKILDAMDKGLLVEQVHSARENLRQHEIRAGFFLQFGYPGESWADIRETVALVRETRPDDIGVSFSYPLPNTKFYELVRQQLGKKQNWSDSDDLCVMFKGAYSDSFYRAIRDALHAEVDSWKLTRASAPRQDGAINELWREIDSLEPISRNSDATTLPGAIHESVLSAPGACRSLDLVPIRHLHASSGER
jgi:anaerobic magnesium-protoporphyrin IX monomethyl ester cyclase